MAKYDTCIVLSHAVNADKSPSRQTRERVDRAVELYNSEITGTLIMSGGYAHKKEGIFIAHSDAMKKYACSCQNVPEENIFVEKKSLETVGQAIFSKSDFVVPKDFQNLIVVSHDYHINRVSRIFEFVFGNDYNIRCEAVDNGKDDPQVRTKEQEQKSLDIFLRTFDGIAPGDDKAILERLFDKHLSYAGKCIRHSHFAWK
jgi:vancomycin permeability regulator SanA